jgi:tetratricopeptide (TPR) repeat protein
MKSNESEDIIAMNTHPPSARIAGRYEVAGRPLLGGMGVVYLCIDHEEDRPVALKTFKPEYLPDRAGRDRFLREGTAWVELGTHPHVVHCYDVLYIDPEVYLVLELVAKEEGRADASLRAWLTPGVPLPVEQALLFALQIARGMAHATARIKGFVHRDLKPENVLVGADKLSKADVNRLRVTDFGLAAVLQETSGRMGKPVVVSRQGAVSDLLGRTQLTHGIVGTPLYMAPEQWQGEPVSAATDVYALGCILYEMLTGQRAVGGQSLGALERAHCGGEVRPLPPGLPAGIGAVVARCLALEAGGRYRDWEGVEVALAAAYEELVSHRAPAEESAAALTREERVATGWSYNSIGASYLDIGKAKVALDFFEQARRMGNLEGDQELEAAGLNQLGLSYLALGDARRAISYHERALIILREVSATSEQGTSTWLAGRQGEGAALGNLATAFNRLGDVQRAIGYYEQQLAITREVGDPWGEVNALNNLGLVHYHSGDAQSAINYFERSLRVARELDDRRGEGNAVGNLGLAYAALGDLRRAVSCHNHRLEIAREIGDRSGEATALGNLGLAHITLKNARQAIDYCEQQLKITREINDRRSEGDALGNLGMAYYNTLGDVRRAIEYYEQSLAIAREIGNRYGEKKTLNNLGLAYANRGDTSRAIECFEQCLKIVREMGDRYREAISLSNLGQAYHTRGDAQGAKSFYEQALVVWREINNRREEGNTMGNLGKVTLILGDLPQAFEFFELALESLHATGDLNGMASVYLDMATVCILQGELDQALSLAQQAAQIWEQVGSPRNIQAQQLVAEISRELD